MPLETTQSNEELEVTIGEGADLVVEVKDDTPPEDKGRKPLDKDPLVEVDTEAEKYTKGVQKRIGELTHKAHDERRRAENAERERDELTRVARAALERSRMLEQRLTTGEAAFATEATSKAELEISSAKAEYRRAFEAGDPDGQSEATAKIAAAAQRLENAKHWASQAAHKVQQSTLQKETTDVDSDASTQRPQQRQTQETENEPDEAANDWGQRNAWFGKDRKMTSFVYGVHEELVFDKGLHPVDDAEEYYAAIDSELRKRFPEHDWQDGDATGKKPKAAAKPATRPSSVVAPVTRNSTGNGRKVTLTATQVRTAEKFGLTAEQYARELIKLQGAE